MFKQTATDLNTISTASFIEWINSFDTVLLDCDGVLWTGNRTIPGSVEVVNYLDKLGKKVYFVTNSPIKTRAELYKSAVAFGFNISIDQIISAGFVAAKYLSDLNFTKKVYLVGANAVGRELSEFGIRYTETDAAGISSAHIFNTITNGVELDAEVGAVVVSFDNHFNYAKLFEASNYLQNPDCQFLATSMDEVYPTRNGAVVPAIGPIVRAIEMSSGRTATILGKPNPNICLPLKKTGTVIPERTLMVGDSANYDVLFGFRCGFQTLLVATGINNMNDVESWQKSNIDDDKQLIPDLYLPKLGDLLSLLKKSNL